MYPAEFNPNPPTHTQQQQTRVWQQRPKHNSRLNVLLEPEVETIPASLPRLEPTAQQQELDEERPSSPVPSGGDPWEDSKWIQYKVRASCAFDEL